MKKIFDYGRLRAVRRKRKIKLADAAKLIGRSSESLIKYENGITNIDTALFTKLCNEYRIDPAKFFVEKIGEKNI